MEQFNPKEIENCHNCLTDICKVCAMEWFQMSEAGRKLRNNPPRFSGFMWPSPERFEAFMGPDVNNFLHGPYQADTVALPMIEAQNASNRTHFSEREARLLYFTHIIHDWHEGIVGDIPLPDKTRESDLAELRVNYDVVKEVLKLDADNWYLNQSQRVMGDFDGQTFLGRAFKAGEYLGYLNTGLRAWAMREHTLLDFDEQSKSAELGRAVLTKNTPTLRQYADEFPYVRQSLEHNAIAIEQANGHSV